MKNSNGFIAIIVAVTLLAGLAAGCGKTAELAKNPEPVSIQVKGSDTMVNLGQAWAEAFMGVRKEVNIAVTGGGSGTGIAALINKTAQVAMASRKMKDKEIEQARANGVEPKEFVVARDGLSVIVNKDNLVQSLTFDQLKKIFTGEVTNWKDVGGQDVNIIVMSRESNSGTYVFFKEHVLKDKDYTSKAMLMPSSQALVQGVAQDKGAIGYVGMGYVDQSVRALPVAADDKSTPVAPTEANVLNGTYPLARPLHLYTAGEPAGAIKDFLDFVLNAEGQKLVKELDFISVK